MNSGRKKKQTKQIKSGVKWGGGPAEINSEIDSVQKSTSDSQTSAWQTCIFLPRSTPQRHPEGPCNANLHRCQKWCFVSELVDWRKNPVFLGFGQDAASWYPVIIIVRVLSKWVSEVKWRMRKKSFRQKLRRRRNVCDNLMNDSKSKRGGKSAEAGNKAAGALIISLEWW